MSFKRGDRIHLHDGRTIEVRRHGQVPKVRRPGLAEPMPRIRGFIRGELVDEITGEKQTGDWYENVITVYGHQQIVRNYAGLHSGSSSAAASDISQLGLARYWAVGYHSEAASSNFSTQNALSTEYAVQSDSGSTAGSRALISAGTQALAGTWSLSQSYQYAATQISNNVNLNAVGQAHNSSRGQGTLHSIATFAASSKSTSQALNITYNFVFSTA